MSLRDLYLTHKKRPIKASYRLEKKIHSIHLPRGPFKYYVIKEVGGWGGQMMMFDDKVGRWGWLNDDVNKKYTRKKTLFACAEKKVGILLKKHFLCGNLGLIY